MTAAATRRSGDRDDAHGQLRSVTAALDVLDCFSDDQELGVTQVARRLGVAKSTAHRLLTALCARGFAEQVPETGLYRLGLHLYELGQLTQDRVPLRHVALPMLEELRIASGQTVHLSIPDGVDTFFIERLQTLGGIPLVGEGHRRMPLHSTSAGKVLLAFNPHLLRARIAAGLPPVTARTITDPAQLERVLTDIRRVGYAHSDGDGVIGLASIAAPVLDAQRRARAAVSIAGPSEGFVRNHDRFARITVLTATKLSRRLGW